MARQSINEWRVYIDDVLALWNELEDSFKVGTMSRADLLQLRDDYVSVLDRINELQAQLGLSQGDRDAHMKSFEVFAVQFRAAVIGQYGPRSREALRVPKVERARKRRAVAAPTDEKPAG